MLRQAQAQVGQPHSLSRWELVQVEYLNLLEQAFDDLAEAVRLLQRFANTFLWDWVKPKIHSYEDWHWKSSRFGGLPETGVVDGETEELMARPRSESHQKLFEESIETIFDSKSCWPRCGVKDLNPQRRRGGRREENTTNSSPPRLGQYNLQGSKWQKKRLSWRVKNSSWLFSVLSLPFPTGCPVQQ